MKTARNQNQQRMWFWLMMGVICLCCPSVIQAITIVECPTITNTTWSPLGNPYIIPCDTAVPSGKTLTIEPGVVVLVGSNVTLTVNGMIQAVGTSDQRITVQAAGAVYWNAISLVNPNGTNRFHYCDFLNAQTAIFLNISGLSSTASLEGAEILNCTFGNCVSQGILANSQGNSWGGWYPGGVNATIKPVVKNCVFFNTSNGCVIKISGSYSVDFTGGQHWGYGYANPTFSGNVFKNLTGTALSMQVGNYAGGSQTTFLNNTLVNCAGGVNAQDPWEAQVENNIFAGCTNAVTVSGSLSRMVGYNDFYNNATNFTGYPGQYGQVIWNNTNGTPADVLYNIFENPSFVGSDDFHLAANSPCIDAGNPATNYTDACFPPSLGGELNDIGAYGGPGACGWLPTNTVGSLTVTINPAGAVSAGALWQVDGGAWTNSGVTVAGLSVGSHTVAFSTVSGYTTPGSLSVAIRDGLTTVTNGTYTVVPPTGSLMVTINPAGAVSAGAQWTVDIGPWLNSGFTTNGLSVGSHTVAYKPVSGYTAPSAQIVTINSSATTVTNGTYTVIPPPPTGSLSVTINPAGAVSAGAQWKVDSGVWLTSGVTTNGLSVGSHTVAFSTVGGYTTPGSLTVTVNNSSTTVTNGTYTVIPPPPTGSLSVTINPAGAVSAGAQWNVDSGSWTNSGVTVSGLSVGSHTVAFSAISGYATSGNLTVTVNNSATTVTNGTYTLVPTYTITASAGANGTINPSGTITKNAGDSQTFTATPASTSYAVDTWSVDGGVVQTNGASYVLSNIQADHTVAVAFKLIPPSTDCPGLTGSWSSLAQNCKTKPTGQQCKIKGRLLLKNTGEADAANRTVRYFLSSDNLYDGSDTLLKQVNTGSIKKGKSKMRTLSATLPSGVSASGKHVLAVYDCEGKVIAVPYGPLP